MVEAAILTCRWPGLRPTPASKRHGFCLRRFFMVNLPHGREIQGSFGVRGLLLRAILRLVRLNGLSVSYLAPSKDINLRLFCELISRSDLLINFKLNGVDVKSNADQSEPLLHILSNDFQLNGQKFGCGKSQCGSCTVLVNGDPLRSCVVPLSAVSGRSVVTLEGLSVKGKPSKLQQAFIQEQAAQCGYCSAGIIMQAQALLDRNPQPTESEVRSALDGNLCRCGAHNRIVRAVIRASKGA